MQIKTIVPLVCVKNPEQLNTVKAFYLEHFQMQVSFEHPTYLGLRAEGAEGGELGFMTSDEPKGPSYAGGGMTYCLQVPDVDAEHGRLTAAGLEVGMPLTDQPWGDRAFTVQDPVGITIYLHTPIQPTAEFAECIKE